MNTEKTIKKRNAITSKTQRNQEFDITDKTHFVYPKQ